jgi:glycosyltransferase involved in cell wall biosynthesis
MSDLPRISIVVPSYNQGQYLAETLQSLADQDYPGLEVIVQEGGSTDDSLVIANAFAARYPGVFQVYAEKDAGQADALNRGFARATGTILGFLNSDDTLFPGVLRRVAAEIDLSRDRYVVMGRSLFTGENSRYVGVEHPAEYLSHFEHLAIWKRGYNSIPQPSVFWHADVTRRVGWLDVNEHHALDYDLFCRFSRHYRFHRIDELFSSYRMHDESKSAQRTEAEVLDLAIGVSRKHWGSWLHPLRWRLEWSHHAYAAHYHEHARHHARRAEQAYRDGRKAGAAFEFLKTLRYSPRMARDRLLYAALARGKLAFLARTVTRENAFVGQYSDGWIGPTYCAHVHVPATATNLEVALEHVPQPGHDGFEIRLELNGAMVDHKKVERPGPFTLSADVRGIAGATATIEVKSASCFVPRQVLQIDDDRELSVKMVALNFVPGDSA